MILILIILSMTKELDSHTMELLKNINECCIKIAINKNLNCKFKKLDSLKNTDFYNNYDCKYFD